jgi:hypothetical protein
MKHLPMLALAAIALAGVAPAARAQDQTVSIEVQAVSQLSFTGSPSLVISTATAGSAPTSATANATYAITTNETNRKITAQLDQDAPTGVTLSANLAAPSGATSAGATPLSSSAQDVVTAVSTVNASGLNLTYTLAASTAAGVVAPTSRTVTYTIIDGN